MKTYRILSVSILMLLISNNILAQLPTQETTKKAVVNTDSILKDQRDSIVNAISGRKNKEAIDWLKKYHSSQDSLFEKQISEIYDLQGRLKAVEQHLSALEIDEFLNVQDISIFTNYDKFMNLSQREVHPRSWNFYCLIKCIYDLNKTLANNNLAEVRTTLAKAINQIKLINKMDINLLSPIQQEYYRSLVTKYGDIDEQINPTN